MNFVEAIVSVWILVQIIELLFYRDLWRKCDSFAFTSPLWWKLFNKTLSSLCFWMESKLLDLLFN